MRERGGDRHDWTCQSHRRAKLKHKKGKETISMPKFIKGLLIVLVAAGLATLTFVLTDLAAGGKGMAAAALVGAILGFLYGLEAGILLIYDLSTPRGWLLLALDMTWSLPNTLFGLVVGN